MLRDKSRARTIIVCHIPSKSHQSVRSIEALRSPNYMTCKENSQTDFPQMNQK